MRARLLLTFSLCAAACGSNTDTTVSDSATQASTEASTGATTSEPATGGLTEASSGGVSNSGAASTGSDTGEPGTSTTTEPGTSTTGEPGTSTTTEPGTSTTTEPGTSTTTDGDESTGPIDDCAQLEAAFAAETAKIRACAVDDECGQPLVGTSCGCTRDWVARGDADTAQFYDLLKMAEVLRCDLVLASTCDCPEADGFACLDGICTWNYL